MTSTVIARKLEQQMKRPEDEVALAQLFSSLLEMGKMLENFSCFAKKK